MSKYRVMTQVNLLMQANYLSFKKEQSCKAVYESVCVCLPVPLAIPINDDPFFGMLVIRIISGVYVFFFSYDCTLTSPVCVFLPLVECV